MPPCAGTYDMYAGDYIPAKTQAELAADQRNKVYYNAADTKLSWSCPTKGSLTYHKTDGTTKSFTGFTRYYCEAYISQATSSRNIQGGERFTATGGELNIGEYQRSQYCSKKTTEPWIQVGQWLKSNNSALPSGNLWIRVSACNQNTQLGDVIFWINAGEVSKLVPVKDLYISAGGNDSSGDGTREKPYATLAKACAAAGYNGDRIVLLNDLTINSTYTVVVMQPDADSAAPGKQPSGIVTGPAAATAPGSGGSGGSGGSSGSSGSGTAVPPVKVDSRDGTVTLSPSVPQAGNRVTITVRPNRGKAVAEVVVTDKRGNRLTVIDNKDGTYTYIQPEKALAPVTVTVRYKSVTGDPSSNGVSDLLITDRHIVYMQGDNMGLFRPTANMTRAEAVQVFYNLLRDKNVSGGPEFHDVPADAWYAPAVRVLSGLGIVKGVGDGAFAPNQTITRAEFVAIASRFADRTAGSATFPDVPADHWAYDSIGQAVYYGWVRGNDDGTFRPGNPISRAEAVRIVNVMLGRSGDRSYIDANAAALRLFPDVAPGYWAYYEIAEAANAHEFAESSSVEIWNP